MILSRQLLAATKSAKDLYSATQLLGARFSTSQYSKKPVKPASDVLNDAEERGKSAFRQLYFPIKRIKFETTESYSKIYSYKADENNPNQMRAKLISRLINHIPFAAYSLGYIFFINTHQTLHLGAISTLFLVAQAKTFFDNQKLNRQITQLYISANGTSFIGVVPSSFWKQNIHEDNLPASTSSIQLPKGAQAFHFTLDDIDAIKLLSAEQEKEMNINNRDDKKTATTSPLTDTKKNILTKLNQIETTKESIIMTVSKLEWPQSQTFRINVAQNHTPQYNDYLIALSYYHRIVMRSSLAPNSNSNESSSSQDAESVGSPNAQATSTPKP